MKMLAYFFMGLVVLASCTGPAKTKETKVKESAILNKEFTTASGLTYKVTHEGDGRRAKAGDTVAVHYTGKLQDGTVFDSSVSRGQPFVFRLGAGQVIKGWDEGIAQLSAGDKAILTVPPHLGYGDRANGPIPANATLIFEVELVSIKEKPQPWDVEGIEPQVTESGLKIYKLKETDGIQPSTGQQVTVHYSGYFEDGQLFDSSVERMDPIRFPLGQGMVIKGWEEGLSLLRKGEKAKIFIPYQLAYGEEGRPPVIPAKANLIFDVELLNVE